MDIREMLAAKLAASMRDDDNAPLARPDMRAQRLELLARFAVYTEPHEFRPGELVMQKDGLVLMEAHGHGDLAMIYWRALDPSDPFDVCLIREEVERTRHNRINCIVGVVSDDGGADVVMRPFDSARLRPLTPTERAQLDAVRGDGDEA